MKVLPNPLPEVLVPEPAVFTDARGHFFESYNRRVFAEKTGVDCEFVQDNHSHSVAGTLRGLHYQVRRPHGKLVRVCRGEIFDVAVDLRRSSPRFGMSVHARLSAQNSRMMWIPPGFAHGFLALPEAEEVLYKTTDYWSPEHEHCVRWDDPALDIPWSHDGRIPVMSAKDLAGLSVRESEVFE